MNEKIINRLLYLSSKAFKHNEVPVAAIITYNNKIIAEAYNKRIKKNSVLQHAEICAIEQAEKKIKDWRLNECELYITLEPCDMCKEVIKASRIKKIYYLIDKPDNKNKYNKTKIEKINNTEYEEKYKTILSSFFLEKRVKNK